MELGKEHAGEKYTDILGWKQGEVVVGDDGWAEFSSVPNISFSSVTQLRRLMRPVSTFSCNAMSVSIWVKVRLALFMFSLPVFSQTSTC